MIPSLFLVTSHTDHVGPGSTFVAVSGMKEHGLQYIPLALEKGATTIVVEQTVDVSFALKEQIEAAGAQLVFVDNARKALAQLSAKAYGYPASTLKILGITATKGKTTTSFLVEHALAKAGYKTALLSTVYNKIGTTILPTTLTTRQPDYLHAFFAACVQAGVEWVVMEVAAQAMSLYRVHGIAFQAGMFMNFAQEHAEFYATYDEYFQAKASFLSYIKPGHPVVLNIDDKRIAALSSSIKNPVLFTSAELMPGASSITGISLNFKGSLYSCASLCGDFNATNMLAALTMLDALGIAIAPNTFEDFVGVPGRMMKVSLENGATVIIDYAHNPSSYEALLSTLSSYTHDLIVVFGCGGERDPLKRPVMGAIAHEWAQHIILTSDNPRSEDPSAIVHDIMHGIDKRHHDAIIVELDRVKAIQKACQMAQSGSIIALLGKGIEEYQLIKGMKHYHSDVAVVRSLQRNISL